MPVCSVSTCRNSSTSIGDCDIVFHSFPRNDKRALEWFIKCKRRDKKRPNSVDRICSIHFQPEAYDRDIAHELLGKPPSRKLKETATPTLSLPFIFIKPSDARKVLTPTLARQLNKRVPQSCGKVYKPQARTNATPNDSRSGLAGNSAASKSSVELSHQHEEVVILKSVTHCQQLLGDVFNDEAFMDTTLVFQEKRIRAHKVILRQASGYFKNHLKEETSTSNNCSECEIKFDSISYEDMSKLIAFIYHGEVSIQSSDLDRFLKASEFLEIPDLKKPDQENQSIALQESNEKKKNEINNKVKFAYSSNASKAKSSNKSSKNLKGNTDSKKKSFQKKNIVKIVLTELQEGLVRFLILLY